MWVMKVGGVERVLFGRLERGSDVLKGLSRIVEENGVKSGAVILIGALDRVNVGYFDEERGKYESFTGEGFYELVSGVGNISWRDGEPVIHIHIAASSRDGDIMMGHLLEGTIVSVTLEYVIFAFDFRVERRFDETTKLSLLDTE